MEGDKKIPSDGECVLYHLQNIFLCNVPLDTTTLRLLGRENRILSVFANKEIEVQAVRESPEDIQPFSA